LEMDYLQVTNSKYIRKIKPGQTPKSKSTLLCHKTLA
jgi:hypothetical protein